MASKNMTSKQKEVIARKLGYDGPMQGFDEFLKSDPALARKYGLVLDKYMARGGLAKKYALGGDATAPEMRDLKGEETVPSFNNATQSQNLNLSGLLGGDKVNTQEEKTIQKETQADTAKAASAKVDDAAIKELYTTYLQRDADPGGLAFYKEKFAGGATPGVDPEEVNEFLAAAGPELAARKNQQASTQASQPSVVQASGQPTSPTAPVITPATITATPGQDVSSAGAPAQAATATGATIGATQTAAAPTRATAETVDASTTAADVAKAMEGIKPAAGTVRKEAQVTAAEMAPSATALSGVTAAEGKAQQVQGAPTRAEVTGEMVTGPAVDMTTVEAELAKTKAAEGTVTKEMTVQGQLDNMLADFDAKNPPPWAAASLRAATAQLAARGLGASSLAGQAIIQSAMEAALPIAQQDAAVFQQMEMQNLSNRQQTAVLLAQQRAAFLGQEFDQEFQTRVVNAAKVSDIANMNFNAQTQIALENARLAQTMDLANLNNKQAVVMANAAQIANLELTNLNNRQQAAVMNAQAFLQMDLQNLSNEQQTTMFKAQSVVQSIFTDAAAENAAKQFNATSKMQVDQFYSSLETQVNQFNASQTNSMEQFRVSQENALAQFNTQQQNLRDQFNAENSRIIAQSNAEWRRQLTLANTQAANEAARINAQNSLAVTQQEYANLWQGYRDDIELAWKTADNAADRDNQIAMQVISKEAQIEAAKMQADALKYQALGGATATILAKTSLGDAAISGVTKLVDKMFNVDPASSLYGTFMTEDDPMGLDTDWGAIDAQEGQDYWGGSD